MKKTTKYLVSCFTLFIGQDRPSNFDQMKRISQSERWTNLNATNNKRQNVVPKSDTEQDLVARDNVRNTFKL